MYLERYWPNAFQNIPAENIQTHYEALLLRRIAENALRGLFIIESTKPSHAFVGLANAYIEKKALLISEFYIEPQYRRQGIAKDLLAFIQNWGQDNHAETLQIEVDKTLTLANQFWQSFEFDLLETAEKNIYSSALFSRKLRQTK
jgi:GNAT superfamily N-acetyltransferase